MNTLVEKRFMIESTRLNREDSIWLLSDITACYDRHIREIRDLILRAHGVNGDRTKTLINNLEAMTTYVIT